MASASRDPAFGIGSVAPSVVIRLAVTSRTYIETESDEGVTNPIFVSNYYSDALAPKPARKFD